MTERCTDYPKGDGHHDQQRLAIAAKGNGQQGKDTEHGQQITALHARHHVPEFFGFPFHIETQTGVVRSQINQQGTFQFGQNLFGVSLPVINIGRNIDHPLTIGAFDTVETPSRLHRGRPGQRQFSTVGQPYP